MPSDDIKNGLYADNHKIMDGDDQTMRVVFYNLIGRNFREQGRETFQNYLDDLSHMLQLPLLNRSLTLWVRGQPILEGSVGECF